MQTWRTVGAAGNPRWPPASSWLPGKPHFLGSLPSFIHHGAFKITQITNAHWWENFYKIAKTVHHQRLTCRVHNPRGTNFVPRGLLTPPSGCFEHLWLDLVQHDVAWVIDMSLYWTLFSGGVEAFPRCKAHALTVLKKLLENMFPPWGVPPLSPVVQAPAARGRHASLDDHHHSNSPGVLSHAPPSQ